MSVTFAPSPWPAPPAARHEGGWRFGHEQAAPLAWLFELRRNVSFSPRQLIGAYLLLCALSLVVALGFWLQGVTIVGLFTGLELLAVGVALLVVARHAGDKKPSRSPTARCRPSSTSARPWRARRSVPNGYGWSRWPMTARWWSFRAKGAACGLAAMCTLNCGWRWRRNCAGPCVWRALRATGLWITNLKQDDDDDKNADVPGCARGGCPGHGIHGASGAGGGRPGRWPGQEPDRPAPADHPDRSRGAGPAPVHAGDLHGDLSRRLRRDVLFDYQAPQVGGPQGGQLPRERDGGDCLDHRALRHRGGDGHDGHQDRGGHEGHQQRRPHHQDHGHAVELGLRLPQRRG